MTMPTPTPENDNAPASRTGKAVVCDALVLPPSSEWKAGGWDIMLQCTACGFRVRRHRNDYNGSIGDAPKPTVTTTCSNCTCNAGYPPGDVKTVHFIDYATKAELAAHA